MFYSQMWVKILTEPGSLQQCVILHCQKSWGGSSESSRGRGEWDSALLLPRRADILTESGKIGHPCRQTHIFIFFYLHCPLPFNRSGNITQWRKNSRFRKQGWTVVATYRKSAWTLKSHHTKLKWKWKLSVSSDLAKEARDMMPRTQSIKYKIKGASFRKHYTY